MSLPQPIDRLDDWFVGEDKDLEYTIYEDDNETVQNITGWTIQFRMATTRTGVSVLTRNALITSPSEGVCLFQMASGDTTSLPPKRYFYTVSRIDSGFDAVLAEGPCVLQGRVV